MVAWPKIKLIQLKKHISATCLPWLPGGVSLLKCKIRQSFVNRFKAHQKSTTHLNRLKISWHVWHNQNGIVTKNRYEMKPTSMRVSLEKDAPNHPSHDTVSVVNPWWLGYPHSGDQQILKFRHSTTGKLMVLGYFPGSQSTNPKTTVNHID